MTTATVNIDSLDKIQAFVKIINEYNGRFDLVSGCSRVNAKSVMGIFSLDISRPLHPVSYTHLTLPTKRIV